ncbi:cell division protein FtsL [Microbulbifer halophilus]|uniref:Cell division protein FtsL n=1 Tax=Microbulbifer halophilus TaxID=453963 RepID=A0ABW5E7H5_9GAMM|nr:cell division protein FtsL [Microbulbifer halophilus]MCW8125618.1 cell division protein FtsL [Microbulbifer halophilus]
MRGKRTLLVAALWLGTIASALAVVHTTQRSRALTAELVEAQKIRDELRFEQERLLLEKGAWSAYSRIEKVARDELNMHVPSPDERVLVPAE